MPEPACTVGQFTISTIIPWHSVPGGNVPWMIYPMDECSLTQASQFWPYQGRIVTSLRHWKWCSTGTQIITIFCWYGKMCSKSPLKIGGTFLTIYSSLTQEISCPAYWDAHDTGMNDPWDCSFGGGGGGQVVKGTFRTRDTSSKGRIVQKNNISGTHRSRMDWHHTRLILTPNFLSVPICVSQKMASVRDGTNYCTKFCSVLIISIHPFILPYTEYNETA